MKQIVSLATVDAFLELDSLDRAWSGEYELGKNESGIGLGLVWFREELCSLHVSIFLPRNSNMSYRRITIENRDAGKSIWYVDFPTVSVEPIGADPEDDLLALPVHGGALIGDPYHGIQWDMANHVLIMRKAGRIFATTAYPASTALYTLDLDGNVLQTRDLQGKCTVMEATPDASLLVLGLDNGLAQGTVFPQVPEIPL